MTAFNDKLETQFLNQLADDEIPKNLDPKDGTVVQAWFETAFMAWFLKHRDDLLARESVRRGWAENILRPTGSSELKETYRVRPECVEKVDAWLQDEID